MPRPAESAGFGTVVVVTRTPWTVVDLFSGGGGASAGFAAHPRYRVVAAADAQVGKPSSGAGGLACNDTYLRNIGVRPADIDLATVPLGGLRSALGLASSPTLLVACPPCTGFSRVNAVNHLVDDPRNSLVGRVADFVDELRPTLVFLENARELVTGRFARHHRLLVDRLRAMGYDVRTEVHLLTRFGLPQNRERALLVAARHPLRARGLDELWQGLRVSDQATRARRALHGLPPVAAGTTDPRDPMHTSPAFALSGSAARIAAIPHDGGSWRDLLATGHAEALLTPAMRRLVARGALGSHPDVYGRMWWDRPAPTIKRECSHVGNGRYAHPEQDRLCTVREMALLQGFPRHYCFHGTLSNNYRHVGDAVPPLISWQIAQLCAWIITGRRPAGEDLVMPDTTLRPDDLSAEHDDILADTIPTPRAPSDHRSHGDRTAGR